MSWFKGLYAPAHAYALQTPFQANIISLYLLILKTYLSLTEKRSLKIDNKILW